MFSDNEVRSKINSAIGRVSTRVTTDGHTRTLIISVDHEGLSVEPQDPSIYGERGFISDFNNVGVLTLNTMEDVVAVVIAGAFHYPEPYILSAPTIWENAVVYAGNRPVIVTTRSSQNSYVFGVREEPFTRD